MPISKNNTSTNHLPEWQEAIDDFLLDCKARLAPKTVWGYRLQLLRLQAWLEQNPVRLTEFKAKQANQYVVWRLENGGKEGKGVSRQTVRIDIMILRLLLDYAYKTEIIPLRPLADYKVPRATYIEQPLLTADQIRAVFRAIEERWNPVLNPNIRFVRPKERKYYRVRETAIFSGLVDTGCRIGEMLALRIEDIDTEKRQFLIRESKNHTSRTVPFSPVWLSNLQDWLKIRPRCDSPLLFVSIYGEPLTVTETSRTFRTYRDLAGLPTKFHLHSLRHYAATTLAESDIVAAKAILGHKRYETTRLYVHHQHSHNKQAHEEANPLGKVMVNKRTEARQIKARRPKLI